MRKQYIFCDDAAKAVASALVHMGQAEVLENEGGRPEFADDPVTLREVFDEWRVAYFDLMAAAKAQQEIAEQFPYNQEDRDAVAFLNGEAIRAAKQALKIKALAKQQAQELPL